MKLAKREGLVIKKVDYSEADRIITVFTKEAGKESFVVKGIRKSKKRERIATDLLVVSSFVIYEKEKTHQDVDSTHLSTLSSVEVLEYFANLKKDLDSINISMYILKMLDFIINENEKNDKVYKLSINTLEYFEKENSTIERKLVVLTFFLISILKHEGIMFDIEDGYFFTIEESIINRNNQVESIKLTELQKTLILMINSIDIKGINKLELKKSDIISLIVIIEKYIMHHLSIYISIREFLVL